MFEELMSEIDPKFSLITGGSVSVFTNFPYRPWPSDHVLSLRMIFANRPFMISAKFHRIRSGSVVL